MLRAARKYVGAVHKLAWHINQRGREISQRRQGHKSSSPLSRSLYRQREGMLYKPHLFWPYGTSTRAFWGILLHRLSTLNAQNGIYNVLGGVLTISYGIYTLGLHILDGGS